MLLTFTKRKFEGLIKQGIKAHTIRLDKNNRWKVGMSIQFWMGNPRNTRGKEKPYQFGTGVVKEILPIEINPDKDKIVIDKFTYDNLSAFTMTTLDDIAVNDGFENWNEMKEFFTEDFVGRLIIWKDFVATK